MVSPGPAILSPFLLPPFEICGASFIPCITASVQILCPDFQPPGQFPGEIPPLCKHNVSKSSSWPSHSHSTPPGGSSLLPCPLSSRSAALLVFSPLPIYTITPLSQFFLQSISYLSLFLLTSQSLCLLGSAGASRWPARASSELCPLLPASSHPHLPAPRQDTAASSNPGPPQPCTPGCRICPWLSSLVPPPPPSSASVQQKGRSLCTTLRQPHAPLLLAPRRPQALQLAALPPATSRPKPPASSRQSPAVACTARRAAAVRGLLSAGRPGPAWKVPVPFHLPSPGLLTGSKPFPGGDCLTGWFPPTGPSGTR